LEEFRAGSKTAAAFAAQHKINISTFSNWLNRKPRGQKAAEASRLVKSRRPRFVAVEAKASAEVEMRVGEVVVRIPAAVGATFFAELIVELAERTC
jgi:hypothetical protein